MLRIQSKLARALGAFGLAAAVALVAGCGGGGGSSGTTTSTTGSTSSTSSTSTGSTSSTGTTTLAAGAPVSSTPATLASNQVAVVVASNAVSTAANIPMVSVTVCVHGTSTCQTIDNIQIDTGSWGLRLTQDALSSTMLAALPTETVSGKTVANCAGFADGNTWGTVRTADLTIGGETASSVPIHVLGDLPQSAAGGSNNSCASGTLNDTSSKIASHGILGIGTAKFDCGSGCQSATVNGVYYGCTTVGSTTTCTDLAVPEAQQVTNPVRLFATDNNGVILNMPAVTATGSTSASGFLTFGIGTQANNVLPGSGIKQMTTDHYGNMQSASLSGTGTNAAFFDTGSNGLFYADSLTRCLPSFGFYCPTSTVSRTPTVTGFNGTATSVALSIGNAQNLFNDGGYAYDNIGGALSGGAFDFGMPFFYGRTVYVNYDPAADGSIGVSSPAFIAF
jgi:Protein of unknown function (DUF3443)